LLAKIAASKAHIEYLEEQPILEIREAIEKRSFVLPPVVLEKGC
jgi:xanthine dehydrogenase molybdopterin-binding subunit B